MRASLVRVLPFLGIIAIPVPSLFWLPAGEVIAHGIVTPWQTGARSWEIAANYLFMWNGTIGVGSSNTEPSGFPYYLLAAVFAALGGSAQVGQSLFFYVGFVGCMGSAYLLGRVLGFTRTAAFIAAVAYVLSPMVMSGMPVEITNLRILPFYAITPLLFAIAILAIRSPFPSWLYVALFGVASFVLASTGYSGPQYLVLHVVLISTYTAFQIVALWSDREARGRAVRTSISLLVLMFLVNLYWLGPLASDLGSAYAARAEPGVADTTIIRGLSVNLIDGFRLLPYPPQADISPWIRYYYSLPVTFISFGFVTVACFALISAKTKRLALYPGLLLVLGLFLAKGIKDPLSTIGEAVFLSLPYVTRLFRNPNYFEMLVVLALTLLVGLGVGGIIQLTSTSTWRRRAVPLTAVAGVFLVYGWQFAIGGPIRSSGYGSSQSVSVPSYVMDLANFLHSDRRSYRVLSVPTFNNKSDYVAYDWGKRYAGAPLLSVFSGKAPISPVFAGSSGTNPLLDAVLHPHAGLISQSAWGAALRISNVRYVALHLDTDWEYLKENGALVEREQLKGFVEASPFIHRSRSFGPIELFEVDPQHFLPHMYASTTPSVTKGGFDFESLEDEAYVSERPAVFGLEQMTSERGRDLVQKITSLVETAGSNPPELSLVEANPTRYRINVVGSTSPFVLVFSEAFDRGWRAYIEPADSDSVFDWYRILGWPISGPSEGELGEHFPVNGYANSWYVDKQGAYQIVLEYVPQRYFEWSVLISLLTFLSCVGYLAGRGGIVLRVRD